MPPAATDAAGGGTEESLRRRELAAFLRSRRERISPHQAGFAPTGRRRTPGLRREEVAQLAGVGVTWYTWLEQGRDIKVSEQVLEAVARTLLLDRDERAHLFVLAGCAPQPGPDVCPIATPWLRQMLTQLEPYPACVQNEKYDLLAYNRVYGKLIIDLDALPVEARNCMWLNFTHPAWQAGLDDWEDSANRMVANLRWAMAEHVAEPAWKAFVSRLRSASPEFAQRWERHEVRTVANNEKVFRNPAVGPLRFQATNTWLQPGRGARMLVYVPANEETDYGVRRLAALVGAQGGRLDPRPELLANA
jgi:transcriptional regulator with XRE-family HTH domain